MSDVGTYAAIAVIVICLLILIYRYTDETVYIVRYYRPSCKYCVESQAAWDEFKKTIYTDSKTNSGHPIVVVDYNKDQMNLAMPEWIQTYDYKYVKSVPTVIKFYKFYVTEYDGLRTAQAYTIFAKN